MSHLRPTTAFAPMLAPDETLEVGADVTEHVPAHDITGQDEVLVLQALAHAGLIGVTNIFLGVTNKTELL